ncbi:MAG: prepilin-type N-terminal cleavage/methylation domain-containing protein [Deltaproteobacteria bacterium]|nr:prepilin-type N-terminal cleavage/methylation domain-containing protein [Deltaproteobacteria bacterium]
MRPPARRGTFFYYDEKGFTLIEMAIVLIIIGIILGAVIKGKDLVRGAEQKKLYSTFLNAWDMAYANYYDRTGLILGDTDTMDNSGNRDGHCSNPSTENLNSQLRRVGLDPPSQGETNSTTSRLYTDSKGRQATIHVSFRYDTHQGNFMRLDAVPNELGIAWDKMVDGQVDGTQGRLLYIPSTGAMGTPGNWPSAEDEPLRTSAAILKLTF